MQNREIEEVLTWCLEYPEQMRRIINTAMDRAGSISRLALETGIRRQSLALWARGAVVPTNESIKLVLEWLIATQDHATEAVSHTADKGGLRHD